MPKDKIFNLPKNVFFAGLTSFFNDFSSEMILSIFPAFFKAVLHSGAASLGLVEGLAEASANFFKIFSGKLSDKINKRKIFAVLGYGLSTIVRPFYIIAGNIGAVMGLRLTDRVGKGLRDAPRDALISLSTPTEDLGKAFGFHRALDTAGAVLGPLVAYFILKKLPNSFNTVFITAFIIGILGVISFLFVSEVVVNIEQVKKSWGRLSDLSYQYKTYLLSTFILACGALPIAVLLLHTQDVGFKLADIPLFYMMYNLAYAIFSIIAGKLADKIGDVLVLILGYICLLVGYLLFNFYNSVTALVSGFVIIGLFSAFTDSTTRSYAGRITKPENRGLAFDYINGAAGFGVLISGIGGGYTWQYLGDSVALIIGAVITIIGLILLMFTQIAPKQKII